MEQMPECVEYPRTGRQKVMVLAEDADLIRKIHKILKTGKDAVISRDTGGKPKIYRQYREIEQ